MSKPDALDEAWASACKAVFGRSLGPLDPYGPWLMEYLDPQFVRRSASGQEVVMAVDDYPSQASFMRFEEVDYSRKYSPLDINQIKDIDSLREALGERVCYAGNVVLGKSSHVERSTDVVDSHFIRSCKLVNRSKYCAYSMHINKSEYCFGQHGSNYSPCAIKCSGSGFTRCFECHSSDMVSDCLYCGSMHNSDHCLFSFGGRGKRHLIGNLQLTRERYAELSQKLIGEIADSLEKNKRIYSLFSILQECRQYPPQSLGIADDSAPKPFDLSRLEAAWQKTTQVLFGRTLHGLESYADYLYQRVPHNIPLRSPFSKREVLIAGYRSSIGELYQLEGRLLTDLEVQRLAAHALPPDAVESLDASSLERLCAVLHPVAYSDLDKVVGKNINVKGTSVTIDAQDCLMGSATIRCKYCAYSFWPDMSENIFGSNLTWNSAFCMRCSSSRHLSRCFEVDSAADCTDCYFCHNVENCEECMFCFNVKAKRYAIGNVEMKKEDYLRIKKLVLAEIAAKLEKNKKLELDIYNIGCKR